MKSRCYPALLCCFLMLRAAAQLPEASRYEAGTIPDPLKKGADAVMRLDEGILTVTSPSRFTFDVHQVITVLNEGGAAYFNHSLHFDKWWNVEEVGISMYDAGGRKHRSYGKKDFEERAAYDGISFITDDKVMHLRTLPPSYPCTIDIRYRIAVSSYLELPDWNIQTNKTATELLRYRVTVPAALDIRHRTTNMELEPVVEQTGSNKVYTWEARNVPAARAEENTYEPAHYLPAVQVAPNQFSYDGHAGRFSSWKEFGQWSYALYEEKKKLPEARVAEVKKKTEGLPDTRSKIAVLYHLLQQQMRYVSIQLGIGGFRPFPVAFVDEKKYGDCKALTNYMRQLLDAAGIKAYPALINAGADKLPADPLFPSSPFNHVILCIPQPKDTIWLECTSNNNRPGFLGSFSENKQALLVTEEGGVLVPTPRSRFEDNRLHTRTDIYWQEEEETRSETRIFCSGDFMDQYRYLEQQEDTERKELLIRLLGYRKAESLSFEKVKDSADGHVYGLQLAYDPLYDFRAGNKFFFRQRPGGFSHEAVKPEANRKKAYLFDHPYEKRDTTVFHLPEGYVPDHLPPALEKKTKWSHYKRTALFDPASRTVTIVATLLLQRHIIDAADHSDMAAFFSEVNGDEAEKWILKKE